MVEKPGKNKWIPNIDDPVGAPSSGSTSPAQPERYCKY